MEINLTKTGKVSDELRYYYAEKLREITKRENLTPGEQLAAAQTCCTTILGAMISLFPEEAHEEIKQSILSAMGIVIDAKKSPK